MNNLKFNLAELSAILYYADFLSMTDISVPVTDSCKYFYIHHIPMNMCYIAGVEPFYDEDNPYYKQSVEEYLAIRNRFGEEGVESFIDDMCNLKACGCVSGEQMLNCIHYYSPRKEREKAIATYQKWKRNLTYKHIVKDDDGKSIIVNCNKEIAHVERSLGIPIECSILKSSKLVIEEE